MRERFRPATVYLIAYIPTFIAVPYLLYYTAGNLEYSWFTHNNLMISIVAQAILFSLAIAAKIRILKDEKEALLREENERLEAIVEVRTSELRAEKMNVEKLLLNILPLEVANELKEKGSSEARHFGNVTVLFTDFVDFTGISQKLSPTELVKEVDHLFKEFDAIIDRNKLEKIKTIGDAYMAVCGLPDEYPNHAHRAVKAALEIRDFIKQYHDQGGLFRIRIGLHSGPVVAGIVGVKKFQYDIWGDTVNTAARMEQNSEPGKVNISGDTYALIQQDFDVEYRGKIQAKNKGEVDMYFVKAKRIPSDFGL
jgi:class 3 adenylate cyclase